MHLKDRLCLLFVKPVITHQVFDDVLLLCIPLCNVMRSLL